MKRFLSPLIALTAGSAVVLGTHPALAHGTAAGGALDGLTHPLLGVDHLFMLMAAGTAASFISSQLLLWALGGAVIGAAVGFTGFTLASAEVLSALAISAVGAMILVAGRVAKTYNSNMCRLLADAAFGCIERSLWSHVGVMADERGLPADVERLHVPLDFYDPASWETWAHDCAKVVS